MITSRLARERAGYLAAEEGATPGPADDFWYSDNPIRGAAGMRIDSKTVASISSAYACVKVLAETVAQLPVDIFRRKKGGGREEATDHPLLPVIRDAPNDEDTSFSFREVGEWNLGFGGNMYSDIESGPRGVKSLTPIHPDTIRVKRLANGRRRYEVTRPNGMVDLLPSEKIFHIPALKVDRLGLTGLNPVAHHRVTLGVAAAQADYGARFYQNNAQPSIVLSSPTWGKEEDRKAAEASWRRGHGGPNRGGVAAISGEVKIERLSMSHRDAQYIDGMKFSAVDVARIFRMPPHMIGILDRATFSNIEMQSIEFVIYTMLPWLIRWESEINRQLLVMADTHFVKFNVAGLLRGNILDRYTAHQSAIQAGWKTRNEVREDEDMNKIAGLDEPLAPLNMAPAGGSPDQSARIARLEKRVDAVLARFENEPMLAAVNGSGDHFEDIS